MKSQLNRFKDLDQYIPLLRQPCHFRKLDEKDLASDPIRQFGKWFDRAVKVKARRPNAMTLATANQKGRPSARTVLLKGFDMRGFVFYTNYESRKAKDIRGNPFGALVFYWAELERQVIISGSIKKVSGEESEQYFQSRPRESCLAAWASRQSGGIRNREELEKKFNELSARFEDRQIPRPSYWGGYRLKPDSIEFWQGRENRLNDRILYMRKGRDRWVKKRLQP